MIQTMDCRKKLSGKAWEKPVKYITVLAKNCCFAKDALSTENYICKEVEAK